MPQTRVDSAQPELTTRSIIVGLIVAVIIGSAYPYCVLKLGRLIFSFVDNPFFKEASVVDTQLTSKARRDLEDIIELSGQIRKTSEQMDKQKRP